MASVYGTSQLIRVAGQGMLLPRAHAFPLPLTLHKHINTHQDAHKICFLPSPTLPTKITHTRTHTAQVCTSTQPSKAPPTAAHHQLSLLDGPHRVQAVAAHGVVVAHLGGGGAVSGGAAPQGGLAGWAVHRDGIGWPQIDYRIYLYV